MLFLIMLAMISCKEENKTLLPVNIIPAPLSMVEEGGFYQINAETKILAEAGNAEIKNVADYFADQFKRASGIVLQSDEFKDGESGKGIIFKLLKTADSLGKEGYLLTVDKKKIILSAVTADGLFRGVQTIFQLLPPEIYSETVKENIQWNVPGVKIYDKPRYAWRGMHLDVSRHFFPKEFVKRYIDLIAMHKMNVFHWHLTDDNGWRIQIDKYPKLTEISAWHVDREHQPWDQVDKPKPGEKATIGGFYTKDEVREIVAYAAQRHITVLPEIEMPGHSSEVLAAYPELSCKGGTFYVEPGTYWPNLDILCAGNDQTFEFIEGVLDEVVELFPGPYIHIGGDEADKTRWIACKKCQSRIKTGNMKDEAELQSWFITRVEKYLNDKGKRMIGWDEILEGGLAPEATVMSWRGFEGGIEAARMGHDVVMSPGTHCYFDHYQANPDFEPRAIGGFTTLKKVYSFDPTPTELTAEEAKHVLGGQANLWSEFISTPKHAEYMSSSRMTALAEALWSPKENLNWDSFRQRINEQFKRYDVMGVNYSKGSFAVNFDLKFDNQKQEFAVNLTTEQLNPEIHFTLDGTAPSITSPVYSATLVINKTTTISAAIFVNGEMKEAPSVKNLVFHQALGSKVKYGVMPDSRYPGIGESTLVDGIKGSENHTDGLWQGFEGDSPDVEIDLGSIKNISSVTATFYQRWKSWIFLPEKIEVSLSEDGKTFAPPRSYKNTIPANQDGRIIEEFKVNFQNQKAQFIRLKAKNTGVCPPWHDGAGGKAWLFVDEVVVE
jgi:hexosaminidase